jgi:bifunctional ADP-heptose synthase (sugar kinase/adenylyltransferase)
VLTGERLEQVLTRAPQLTIGVLGDLFLDRYLDLDARLTEPSLETGLDAYQVVGVRAVPGAAGTILNNLVALGVGRVCPIAAIGDDGEGYELRRALAAMPSVDTGAIFSVPDRRTPTYTKPLLYTPDGGVRELNRLDIHNRTPLPAEPEWQILDALNRLLPAVNALLVLDQVSLPDCGVVTARVRVRLAELAAQHPEKFILADSRELIGQFRNVCIKPNLRECYRSLGREESAKEEPRSLVAELARRCGRMVFCTRGERGQLLALPGTEAVAFEEVPGYPVTGPVDPVGAGDSTSAGIATAVAAGLSFAEAAAFGNLVASITVQQIGTTGTASPTQLRQAHSRSQAVGLG